MCRAAQAVFPAATSYEGSSDEGTETKQKVDSEEEDDDSEMAPSGRVGASPSSRGDAMDMETNSTGQHGIQEEVGVDDGWVSVPARRSRRR